ncbi:MAG: PH domain-containing protein [Verrucomicrobia bacterium]|nr:PH domain-containing protein [Verrucomicrobiota bacterium]
MSEQTLWRGTSSQFKNLWPFVSCILVVPIPWAVYRWLEVKSTVFELTTERLITERGILSKTKDSLELYRVRDLQVTQPVSLRLFGLSLKLGGLLRTQVEETRMAKRVRTVDVEDGSVDSDGHSH